MCFPFEYHDEDPKDLFSLRLTAARTTVTSSTLPPATLPNPLARAFFANGDKKFSSCDNLRAINAMEFAQAYKLEKKIVKIIADFIFLGFGEKIVIII